VGGPGGACGLLLLDGRCRACSSRDTLWRRSFPGSGTGRIAEARPSRRPRNRGPYGRPVWFRYGGKPFTEPGRLSQAYRRSVSDLRMVNHQCPGSMRYCSKSGSGRPFAAPPLQPRALGVRRAATWRLAPACGFYRPNTALGPSARDAPGMLGGSPPLALLAIFSGAPPSLPAVRCDIFPS